MALVLPAKTTHITFRSTKGEKAKPSFFLTGMPGNGKTTLGALILQRLISSRDASDILGIDFPEEDEGVRTMSDMDITFATVKSIEALDELYDHACRMKPKGILCDGLPAAWKMFFETRCPGLVMANDNGKTWNVLATDICTRLITRFKSIPSVEAFVATSTVWPDKDEITGQDKRLQTTLPGQLKGNVYGLFSYCFNIKTATANGQTVHVLETMPDANVVAKRRVPLGKNLPRIVAYDLAAKDKGIDHIVKTLELAA